ncbi:MAG: hypothetical protein ACREBA_06515 [Nitrosotalea sp.]
MTYDFNDAHQLKIKKLQEKLGNISGGLRKNLTTEIQKEKQMDIDNRYSVTIPSPTQIQQKQFHDETEKKQSVEEILQEIKQQVEHKRLETINIVEAQQESNDVFSSENSNKQDLDQTKQNIIQDSKSWQPWKYIPRKKLGQLEKKTLSNLFKKD